MVSKRKAKEAHMALYRVGSTVNVHGFTVGPVYCVKVKYHGRGRPPPEMAGPQGPAVSSGV